MGRLSRRWIGVAVVGALPMIGYAQTPFNLDVAPDAAKIAEIGGTAAIDIITLKGVGVGAPLRYGNVVPNSERVQLDNQLLTVGTDYMMDYGTGVVYLKRAQHSGQVLTVSYRYKEGPVPPPSAALSGLGGFKYAVAPGSLTMLMGLGLAERAADGTVLQSNVFGWQNNFKLAGGGAMNGLYIYGDRQKTDNQQGLSMNMDAPAAAATPVDEGKSQFLLQNMQTSLGKTKISVDYQDISKNFTSFGQVKSAGYDDATVNRLSAEKGLTRLGYSVTDLGGISSSFKDVKDDKGAISWRSFGFNQGALKVNWNTQKVDSAFARFNDIAEADKAQLAKEIGMSRSNLSSEFASKVGKLSYSDKSVTDDTTGQEIKRSEYGFDGGAVKLNYGSQNVTDTFGRMANLLGEEQALYGKEAGLSRNWMGLQASIFGGSVPISFSQSLVNSAGGSFKSQDMSVKAKTWSLEHVDRSVDSGFTRLDALQETAANNELANNITSIGKMYGTTANPAAERGWFLQSSGIDRSYTKLTADPFKDWKFSADRLELNGQQDGGHVDKVNLDGKNVSFNYRRQDLGSQFTELTRLMAFEQAQLGTVAGLDRTDLGMNVKLGGQKQFGFSQMSASTDAGDAKRSALSFKDKKIDVQVNTREVSSGFSNVNQLVDPEKDLLAAMTGFKQTEGKIAWQLNANLNFQAYLSESRNETTNEERKVRNMVLDWADKRTKFNYTSQEQHNTDPVSTLFANNVERISLTRDLGRLGVVSVMDETVQYDGTTGTTPDWHKRFFAYETKVNAKTTVRTEQTRTDFENGNKENIDTNSVSTELTKKLGVTLSNTHIDRTGQDQQNETKRNYGLWVDLGNGLRMSYGYVRNMAGETTGSMSSSFAVGQNATTINPDQTGTVQQGSIGGMQIGGAYGANQWDDQLGRTQSFSNVNISTAKPFRFLNFTDVKFNMAMDTSADNATWLKENRLVGATGKVGANTVGFEYKSQIHTSGYRGIDRTFTFSTDQTDKTWLHAAMKYKVRTLPWDETIAIRDYNISAKPIKNLEISNQMITNPEVFQAAAFLGSVPQASRANNWRMDYKANPNFTFGGTFQEMMNESTNALSRTAGLNLKFMEAKGSPISLFYGVEQSSDPTLRRTIQRYSIKFDQKPGPNQTFSLFLGNLSYENSIADSMLRNNITARLDFQLRF